MENHDQEQVKKRGEITYNQNQREVDKQSLSRVSIIKNISIKQN